MSKAIPTSNAQKALERLKKTQPPLVGLFAVLGCKSTDRLLLLYNNILPTSVGSETASRHWAAFDADAFKEYDGLVLALKGMALLLPNLPANGSDFHPLEPLFCSKPEILRENYRELVKCALALSSKPAALAAEVLLRMRLPEAPNAFGIAVAALETSLDGFPAGAICSCQPESIEEWEKQAREAVDAGGWFSSFEEIPRLYPAIDLEPKRWIDLRPLLRDTKPAADYRALVMALAHRAHARWNATGQAEHLRVAYSLALEARFLAAEDPENIVAILPHSDFQHFIKTGDAIKVYRDAQPSSAAGSILSLGELVQKPALPFDRYGPAWFSVTVLGPFLESFSGKTAAPLGPILFKAAKTKAIARTYWLLSRDLLHSNSLQNRIGIPFDKVVDLAVRALALYDLDEPWNWRQERYQLLRERCRADALEAIKHQIEAVESGAESGLGDYWRGLSYFFSSFRELDRCGDVARMPNAFRSYLESPLAGSEDPRRLTAERLLHLGSAIFGGGRAAFSSGLNDSAARTQRSLGGYLALIADDSQALDTPSPLLIELWNAYTVQHEEIEKLNRAKDAAPDDAAIDRLLCGLRGQLRVAHLPAHELSLMRYLYREDIRLLEDLREAMGPAAQIGLRVLNPWLDEGIQQTVCVEVENEGGETARAFEMDVIYRDAATPPIEKARLKPAPLRPGPLRPPVEFQISASGPTAIVRAAYRFSGVRGGSREVVHEFNLEVRPPPHRPWALLSTPYEAGIAVFGRDRFFGRDTELRKIFSVLAGGITQPVLIRGPRRMGKTSLLKQIEWLLKNQDELHSAAHSLGKNQLEALGVIRPVVINLQSISATGAAANAQFFSRLLDRVCDAAGHEAISWAPEDADPVYAFRNGLDRVLTAKQCRLLIMVDEWDETSRPGLERLGANLRSVMLDEQRVNWIICSTWIMRHEGRQSGSPLHNMCHILEVKEPDWKSARTIVTEPSHRIGLHWHGHAVVAAVEQSGRLPFLIQTLGAAAVDRLNSDGRKPPPVVGIETVNAVIGQMVRGDLSTTGEYFQSIFDQGGDGEDAVRAMGWMILWVLNRAHPASLSLESVRRQIFDLAKEGGSPRMQWASRFDSEFADQFVLLDNVQYVIEQDEERLYHIRVPIFRAWFNFKAAELFPQMMDRLRNTLTGRAAGANP
ncbi:MAG: ATP-binding protein [Rhodomicrobium sp.]